MPTGSEADITRANIAMTLGGGFLLLAITALAPEVGGPMLMTLMSAVAMVALQVTGRHLPGLYVVQERRARPGRAGLIYKPVLDERALAATLTGRRQPCSIRSLRVSAEHPSFNGNRTCPTSKPTPAAVP